MRLIDLSSMIGRVPTAIAMAGLAWFLTGCTTVDVDVGYDPDVPVAIIDEKAATVTVGHFIDMRDQKDSWIGEIHGKFHYPKQELVADRPLVDIVRDIIEQAAYDRGMLVEADDRAAYQIYGQITRFDGTAGDSATVHAHLVTRLFDMTESRDVYTADHEVKRFAFLGSTDISDVEDFIEQALNDVIAKLLDDPKLRAILLPQGEES